ncbi:hypothetical protein J4727_15530 [Providencia rettgeri]|uniref:Uncharacterized protein n=1 Tax=Providencia rettgeri TaxID=587 RepID=A0A939NCA9_PRORE|nr:hypothetical protein [Providencia rettgeri]
MYADKITLISTGNNSAISNKGSAGDDGLRIASNGNIFNYKTMDAISDVNITATSNPAYAHNLSGIENTGAIKSKTAILISILMAISLTILVARSLQIKI